MGCETNQTAWKFEIDRPLNGSMTIQDELITTYAIAKQRSDSEFLKNSFATNIINFQTAKTSIKLNDSSKVSGRNYVIKNISYEIDMKKIISTITAQRYD